jgi:hypothetical protein
MEKEDVEIEGRERGDEMMSAEAANLLSELNSEIAYGEVLGVFTSKEASKWYAGADACAKIEHLYGLLRYLSRFIASGEARLRQLERAADNELLTGSEQRGYLNEAYRSTYQAKGRLIEEIKGLIRELEKLKAQLISILGQKNIPTSEKSLLISKFYSSSAAGKSSVVSDAENIRIEEPVGQKSEEPAAPDQPSAELEVIEPLPVVKDPKAECLSWVEHYLKHDQFSQAADLVEASSRHFNLMEYRALLKRIEKAKLAKEIPDLQALLRAA